MNKAKHHGLSNTKTYISWNAMRLRCFKKYKHNQYKNYGGRGIKPCNGIRLSFVNFYNVMGERPTNKSLDRIDNNKGYTCGQCKDCIKNESELNMKWSTRKEQNSNKNMYSVNKTGYTGVYKQGNKYYAAIRKDKILHYLGTYLTSADAGRAVHGFIKGGMM